MSLDQNKDLIRRAAAAQDRGDEDGFVALLSPDYRVRFPGESRPIDREGHRQIVRSFRAAFPDGEHVITNQAAEGDVVFTRGIWRGSHQGDFQGIPPTGRTVAIGWIMFARISGDLVAEVELQADFLGLMQQLGAGAAAAGAPV